MSSANYFGTYGTGPMLEPDDSDFTLLWLTNFFHRTTAGFDLRRGQRMAVSFSM